MSGLGAVIRSGNDPLRVPLIDCLGGSFRQSVDVGFLVHQNTEHRGLSLVLQCLSGHVAQVVDCHVKMV